MGRKKLTEDESKSARCIVQMTPEERADFSRLALNHLGVPLSHLFLNAAKLVKKGIEEKDPAIMRLCKEFGLEEQDTERCDKVRAAHLLHAKNMRHVNNARA